MVKFRYLETKAINKIVFAKKSKALIRRPATNMQFRTFGLPACCLKTQRLRYTELQYYLSFGVDGKLVLSHYRRKRE